MALEKLTDNVEIHQTLGDAPNSEGMSAADLKAKFDQAAKIIKQFINDRIVPNALDKRGDTMKGVLRLGGNRIVDLPAPEEETDAANKAYVDAGLASKAPAGYGLGETGWKSVGITDVAQLDNLKTNGGYRISQTIGSPLTLAGIKFNVIGMQVNMMNSSYGEQVVQHTYGIRLRRHFDMGSWQPWEYDNPPMDLGVEYRTTERWNGRAVYTKLVNIGAFSDGAGVIVPLHYRHGAIRAAAWVQGYLLPYWQKGVLLGGVVVGPLAEGIHIGCISNGTFDGIPTYVQIWYVKEG